MGDYSLSLPWMSAAVNESRPMQGPGWGHSRWKCVFRMFKSIARTLRKLPDVTLAQKTNQQISRGWISCNFYCTFLFGLAMTFHLFELVRPRSGLNTQVRSGTKWPRVTHHRSDSLKKFDLKHREVTLSSDLWLVGLQMFVLTALPTNQIAV